MKKIKLIIADNQLLTREVLRTILDLEDDMEVIGMADNGEEACELAVALQPDLVLLGFQKPVMDGIDTLKEIKTKCPGVYILILTTFLEAEYIMEAMANGASGYMLKDMDGDKIIAAVRDTVRDQFILPAPVAAKLAERMSKIAEGYDQRHLAGSKRMRLTDREMELARLIMRGLNNREIADTLGVTEGTARNYISSLYGKLEVVDRAQALTKLQTLI